MEASVVMEAWCYYTAWNLIVRGRGTYSKRDNKISNLINNNGMLGIG